MPELKNDQTKNSLTIIGLGPMGQAMVRSYLTAGYAVTVWNRTTSKAEVLEKEGAVRAETIKEALQANKLIILSLTEYSVMYKILDGAENNLIDRTLINLSSDTPENARKAEKWAHGHEARFLSGGIMVDPPLVGIPDSLTFYSGERKVFDTHHQDLSILGKADYRGSDAGLSQLYNQALLNILFTGAASVLQSMAIIQTAGVAAKDFEPYVMDFLNVLPYFFQEMASEADTTDYRGDQNNMRMMAASAEHVAYTAKDAGVNTALTNVVLKIYQQTVELGHGADGLTSIIEVLKKDQRLHEQF